MVLIWLGWVGSCSGTDGFRGVWLGIMWLLVEFVCVIWGDRSWYGDRKGCDVVVVVEHVWVIV